MLHQTRDQRLIVNEVHSLEVLMVDEGQQSKNTTRNFALLAFIHHENLQAVNFVDNQALIPSLMQHHALVYGTYAPLRSPLPLPRRIRRTALLTPNLSDDKNV